MAAHSHSLTPVSSQAGFSHLLILRTRIKSKFVKGKKLWTVSLAHPTYTPIQNLKANAKISLHIEPAFPLAGICIVLFKHTHSTLI